jgi:hypothetical protein
MDMAQMKNLLKHSNSIYLLLRILTAFCIVYLALGAALPALKATAAPNAGVILPSQPIAYALDYATTEFKDAWDMSQFTDISQYLNGSGRHVSLSNPTVKDGLFSATTIGDRFANLGYFYMVFPDYATMSRTGKLGKLHPIKTSQYSCLYIAMRVNSPAFVNDPNSYYYFFDGFRVMWYANDYMSPQGAAPNGGTAEIKEHIDLPSYNDPYPTRLWKLFKVDLTSPPNGGYGVPWLGAAEWQGLEIQPSMFKNVDFQVDWIKLTNNCTSETTYQVPISFSPVNTINSVWVNPSGTTRNIRVAIDVNGISGQYTLNTKGLAAGKYKVGVGDKVNCCTQWSSTELTINTPPSVTFSHPSPSGDDDYSTQAGNAWDMSAGNDVTALSCTAASFSGGLLNLTTQYPANVSAACRGGLGEVDAQIQLTSPLTIQPNSGYRYLSFRMYQSGPWQYVADGMMVRWMWRTPDGCTFVGNDIPLDVGWNTYIIDLYDPINGTPVAATAPCSQLIPWKNAPTISSFRFDPNENYTGVIAGVPAMVFDQKIDWIKLTRVDHVKAGNPYTVEFEIDKTLPASAVTVYYTSDMATPKQHIAIAWSSIANSAAQPFRTFVPMVNTAQTSQDPGLHKYSWNTTGVAAGEYYICTEVNDGFNKVITCSDAPASVTN